ncbi:MULTISPECIES: TetR family transcriptional regulator [Actinosynnema]|uniref:TetR family transcriptional regulator n=1 Tax=Actinosynnema pretiosum TaxID=42197 RepID=A0A290ZAC9_9PSEU|nr:TetR family transcriptional regulator [Actinosynnema pretiosum]ATE55932.1 TetR family transcriptional regulator [Actinosynnema pretiosum]
MARWKPGTPDRLQEAALELFATRGFEQTTAQEIAQAVGLTERTFFRHFSDKREVLFHRQDEFTDTFRAGIALAPPDAPPIAVIASALRSSADFFPDEARPWSRRRHEVISGCPALREREQHKLVVLAGVLADELRARGVDATRAALAARTGAAVFQTTFELWLAEGEERGLDVIAVEVLAQLREVLG